MQNLCREDGQEQSIGGANEQQRTIPREHPGHGRVTFYCSKSRTDSLEHRPTLFGALLYCLRRNLDEVQHEQGPQEADTVQKEVPSVHCVWSHESNQAPRVC